MFFLFIYILLIRRERNFFPKSLPTNTIFSFIAKTISMWRFVLDNPPPLKKSNKNVNGTLYAPCLYRWRFRNATFPESAPPPEGVFSHGATIPIWVKRKFEYQIRVCRVRSKGPTFCFLEERRSRRLSALIIWYVYFMTGKKFRRLFQ